MSFPYDITPLPLRHTLNFGGHYNELGSGTRKLMRYGKIYGGTNPEMIEGDIFRTTIKMPEYSGPNSIITESGGIPITTEQETLVLTSRQKEIITILATGGAMSLKALIEQLNNPPAERTVREDMTVLKKLNIINSRGLSRATTWFVVK